MRDFTLKIYEELLRAFEARGYRFYTFEEYCGGECGGDEKFVVLRHDVDLRVENSLATAKIENSISDSRGGIRASYYFRTLSESNNPQIIKDIVELGHEVGYHYEDMSLCDADPERAVEHFGKWLEYFRTYYPVKTICMHGAPTSKYDSKDIWQFANYRDFGLIGEPYFDTDFTKLFYITDTGRRWDGYKVSLRDKIPEHQDRWEKDGLVYHSTNDVIEALKNGVFPRQLMMTTHPQRWTDDKEQWLVEWVKQGVKNVVKRVLVCVRK